jgi:transposase InsO family protein
MTSLYVKGKYYELTFYFDAYTKEILSYKLSSRRGDASQYYDGLLDVLEIIKKEELTEPTVLHTDQGSVYSSISYNELIKDYNIKRSMNRAGTPTDNPVDESLNGWIKEELFLDFNIGKSNDVNQSIKDYVHYYNNERFSYALKYKTPAEFKSQLGFH